VTRTDGDDMTRIARAAVTGEAPIAVDVGDVEERAGGDGEGLSTLATHMQVIAAGDVHVQAVGWGVCGAEGGEVEGAWDDAIRRGMTPGLFRMTPGLFRMTPGLFPG
jgi:hypothetical protein